MIKYTISALLIYLIIGLFLFFFQRKIIFNTSGIPKKPEYYGLLDVKEVSVTTSDGLSLLSWYKKAKNNNPTLLYLHGNSFDIGERSYRIERYLKHDWGILLLAWRGYSGNKGKPTEKNLYEDAESALRWLKKNNQVDRKEIVLYGESLGTGVAVELGTRYVFKSIVLEAPFTSIYDIAKKRYKIYPTKFLVLDKFENLTKINNISSPLLVISGKKDEIVPHTHSKLLFDKANNPKESLFIDEAMHNNLYDFGIERTVINFALKIWK